MRRVKLGRDGELGKSAFGIKRVVVCEGLRGWMGFGLVGGEGGGKRLFGLMGLYDIYSYSWGCLVSDS